MSELSETLMDWREESMVSPVGDSKPTLRTAHFLKPSITSNHGPLSKLPSSSSMSSLPPTFEPKKCPLTVKFNGWSYRPKRWVQWVDSLHSTYESVWRKVGIYEAIMSTKCNIMKNEELIFGITERWCSQTNTFVFPWAEATITLEDIMVLGSYPVLGASVFSPLDTQELKEIEEKLIQGRKETWRSKSNKACISTWISIFMNSGREIEHEAFLAAWLSMFVFPEKSFLIRKLVLPIATHLAKGNPIALAPAVLAAIYKDLTLLKQTIVDLTKIPIVDGNKKHLELVLRSPFYLVQLWVWERIEALQPKPKMISQGDPVLARWHRVKALEIDNVRSVLDSAMEQFIWRPYARFAGKSNKFYAENSKWVPNDHTLDEEIMSFVICLRVSELVGLDSIEQYLPHRVAMQFGMDQDIPGNVTRISETPEIAWANYSRPIIDSNVYIPSRFFEADVTTRYAVWWEQSVLDRQDPVRNVVKGKRSPRSSKKRGNDADIPPGFPPKCRNPTIFGNSYGFLPKRSKTVVSENSVEKGSKADVSPGFPPKITLIPGISVEECKPTILSNQSQSSFASTADCGTLRKMELQTKPHAKFKSETSMGGFEEAMEYENGSQQLSVAYDRVNLSGTEGEGSSSYTFDQKIMDLENRISRLERVFDELKIPRFSHSSEH